MIWSASHGGEGIVCSRRLLGYLWRMADTDPAPLSRTPLCVIANPHSGSGEAGGVLQSLLARHPGSFDLYPVRGAADLTAAARRAIADGYGGVVAAGGDGTVNAVANAVVGTSAHMGVLPMGTFNYFARGVGFPEDHGEAVDTLAAGRVQPCSVGRINETIFVNNASFGLYPAILQKRERLYRKWGRSRFLALWSAMRTILRFRSGYRMKITVDGVAWRMNTPAAFIACNPYQLRMVKLDGADAVEEGKLVMISAPDCGRWQLVLNFLRLGAGLAQRGREFEMVAAEEIRIETRRRKNLIAIDGERMRLEGPYRLQMLPDAIHLIVPAEVEV